MIEDCTVRKLKAVWTVELSDHEKAVIETHSEEFRQQFRDQATEQPYRKVKTTLREVTLEPNPEPQEVLNEGR